MRFPNLAARIFNTPLMVEPQKARVIVGVLSPRFGFGALGEIEPAEVAPPVNLMPTARPAREARIAESEILGRSYGEPYTLDLETGIARLSVEGTLAHRQGYIGASSGVTGYDGISAQIEAIARDSRVLGALVDIHSPGGEVYGAFDTAAKLRSLAELKPVWAVANEAAFSAAYLLGSAATAFFAPRTAQVGSIGVLWLHLDHSGMLEREGVVPTFITAGALKSEGNPLEPLSAETVARVQTEVNETASLFYETVAEFRDLEAGFIESLEAGIFGSAEAVKLGLLDEVASVDEVEEAFAAYLQTPRRVSA